MDAQTRQVLPAHFRKLASLSAPERSSIRWLIRFAEENGIVREGIVIRFGRNWWIDTERLPDFLRRQSTVVSRGRAVQ
jgi:hypothetical protein